MLHNYWGVQTKSHKGIWDFDLFRRLIDEVHDKIFSLRLSFRGEATLHANFAECISYAKKAGIKEISTLTNGGNLFGTNLDRIITAGIDWITVSIDGLGETMKKLENQLLSKRF